MIKGIKFLIVLCLSLTINDKLVSQDSLYSRTKISIEQLVLPEGKPIIKYEINRRYLTIYKSKTEIFSRKLNRVQIDSLNLLIEKIDLTKINNYYSSGYLDGVVWTFNFESKESLKTIRLDNYYLPELGSLVEYLNRQLPNKRRYITFNQFNIKKNYKEQN
jgi:hypothetical protein